MDKRFLACPSVSFVGVCMNEIMLDWYVRWIASVGRILSQTELLIFFLLLISVGHVKLISWNIRGLRDPNKQRAVFDKIADTGASIICLQETHISKNEAKEGNFQLVFILAILYSPEELVFI